MAPILIDQRGLVKIGFIAVSTAVFIFISGFFSGYQRASVIYQPGSETASLALPEIVTGSVADIEPHRPEVIAAGEDIDVDQPEVPREEKINVLEINSGPVISNQPVNAEPNEKDGAAKSTVAVNKIDGSKIDSGSQILDADSEALKKIKYSIQVGTYGSLANAENMVRKLQTQKLDAYVSEYSNKKNKTLYNVRFGYFIDKKSAVSALDEYKSGKISDGYLVRLAAKDTTSTAEVEVMKHSSLIEQEDNDLSPAPASVPITSDVPQENISQLEMSKASATLTNNQTHIVTN